MTGLCERVRDIFESQYCSVITRPRSLACWVVVWLLRCGKNFCLPEILQPECERTIGRILRFISAEQQWGEAAPTCNNIVIYSGVRNVFSLVRFSACPDITQCLGFTLRASHTPSDRTTVVQPLIQAYAVTTNGQGRFRYTPSSRITADRAPCDFAVKSSVITRLAKRDFFELMRFSGCGTLRMGDWRLIHCLGVGVRAVAVEVG